jgi:hypothetical protein
MYLKDVVLLRQLDDATTNALNQTVFFNNLFIVNSLAEDEVFLPQLFALILQVPGSENMCTHVETHR